MSDQEDKEENTEVEKITEEQFAVLCVNNAAYKFLRNFATSLTVLMILYLVGIFTYVTFLYSSMFVICAVLALYFIDMILVGRRWFLFTSDFIPWVRTTYKELEWEKRVNKLKEITEKAKEKNIHLETEDDKITRYNTTIEEDKYDSNEYRKMVVDSLEVVHIKYGRDYTLKMLGDVLAGYAQSLGAENLKIESDAYNVSVDIPKKKESEEDKE